MGVDHNDKRRDARPDAPEREPPHLCIERLLRLAVEAGASDVYAIPAAEGVRISQRIDGSVQPVALLAADYGQACVTRVKVLGGLLTYRSRIPQDGAIHGLPGAPEVECRVASLPTHHGERLTIRILDRPNAPLELEDLGFPGPVGTELRQIVSRDSGMLVLTGPTGSGKTTTIYALLRFLLRNQPPAGIITIEDPIESDFSVLSQVPVGRTNEHLDYKTALRAALRQDVKVIVIGELRDADVLHVALDAALTGHLVVTTFHAGDIGSVYARMLHQGFEPFLVGAAVSGVLNQRLVRRLCAACRRETPPSLFAGETQTAWEAPGCEACQGLGYRGRLPLAAFLEADADWCDLVATNPGLGKLREASGRYPLANLRQAGVALLEQGLTDEVELARAMGAGTQ